MGTSYSVPYVELSSTTVFFAVIMIIITGSSLLNVGIALFAQFKDGKTNRTGAPAVNGLKQMCS
jgi:hypothetical protein